MIKSCAKYGTRFSNSFNPFNSVKILKMKNMSVLQDAPFTDNGSVVEVFTDLSVWLGIKRVIDRINANAIAA